MPSFILIKPASTKFVVDATYIVFAGAEQLSALARARVAMVVDDGFAIFHEYIMTTDADKGVALPG